MKKFTNRLFSLAGFLVLAFVAVNMNACSKDKGNNNQYPPGWGGYGGGYGNVGGGHLGNGVGVSGDGAMTLQLSFAGQNGGPAGATGVLIVQGPSVACAVPPGQYMLQTIQPGIYFNGDFYPPNGQGITLMANNGMQIYVEGFLNMQQDQFGNRRMFANANIPGCPTMFN